MQFRKFLQYAAIFMGLTVGASAGIACETSRDSINYSPPSPEISARPPEEYFDPLSNLDAWCCDSYNDVEEVLDMVKDDGDVAIASEFLYRRMIDDNLCKEKRYALWGLSELYKGGGTKAGDYILRAANPNVDKLTCLTGKSTSGPLFEDMYGKHDFAGRYLKWNFWVDVFHEAKKLGLE